MKHKTHKILECKLIKVEKIYNQARPDKLFYNLIVEDLDEPLLIEVEEPLDNGIVGLTIKYKLNAENEVINFEFM